MIEIFKTLRDTPLPSILVIGGIVFLLLSFVRKFGSDIELEPKTKVLVGFIGVILLCAGTGLYIIPAVQTPLANVPTETPRVESTAQAIPPTATIVQQVLQQTAVSTVPPNNSTSRPSPIHIVNGSNYSMPEGWFWVCTGDFSTEINGIKKAWYDVGVSNTGLVFVLQPDTTFTISGAFEVSVGKDVGDCLPYAQNEKDSAITGAISAQFDRGCGSKCQYVNVIELDKNGNEVSNYWTPQKP
jgi:hypothetical protein